MSRLAPLPEVPSTYETVPKNKGQSWWRDWIKTQLPLLFLNPKKSHLKLLLNVLGCPLSPIPSSPSKHSLLDVSSTAQYIIQHFMAATGCKKLMTSNEEGVVKNMYIAGQVKMVVAEELGGRGGSSATSAARLVPYQGCFFVWQMFPNKWLIELAVSGNKVVAGSDGNVSWRHTPWLGVHAAKGGIRPLRRALQGLDPVMVASVFSTAQLLGEKRIWDEDCFVLKISADPTDLACRSDSTADIVKHVIIGYFSQRSGLLIHLEDSHLTRIQSPGTHPTYWETIMGTKIEDYRMVDNVMIAHSGYSTATLIRFGNNVKVGPQITRLEELWTIDDVVFNVHGLSMDFFIPPEEIRIESPEENLDWKTSLHQLDEA
ncbi:hypothetical protein Syun_017137 [Stephania yunnanensis]|uniref:Uncharacterized protein n=1 Tax=Stephania yunnanensis TaxID=152371 RepID=A0AAP0J7Y9_9MAGN